MAIAIHLPCSRFALRIIEPTQEIKEKLTFKRGGEQEKLWTIQVKRWAQKLFSKERLGIKKEIAIKIKIIYKETPNEIGANEMTKETRKRRTMREMDNFYRNRAYKLQMWRNAFGYTREYVAEKLGCTAETIRLYENAAKPQWIPAHRLVALANMGCPRIILYLDGKFLHELVVE